jgi:tetratricopeptide (TPR) repeat protein
MFASPPGAATQAPGQWQLGIAALQAGDGVAAIEHFEESLRHHPGYWYAWRDLGRARLDTGDLQGAEAALKRGLSIRGNEPWLADLLADVYFAGGNVAAKGSALRIDRARVLRELGQDLLHSNPAYATAQYHLARAALLVEDTGGAEGHVRSGLSLDSGNFQCLFLDARLRSLAGDKDGACAAIERALSVAARSHDPEHEALASDERRRIGCP